jgi:hypothetical protein
MKRIAVAVLLLCVGSGASLGQEAGSAPGRFRIHTDVYFYDTDILRDAYSREPYRTTILVDTVTGRSWILMKVGDNRVVWSSVDFATPTGPTPGLAPSAGARQ